MSIDFSYFKCFNEADKLNSFIRDENNWINYDDLLLDYIYEKRDLNLAEIIFPLVEDKILLTKFINILNKYYFKKRTRWINVIFNNGFNEINGSQIDTSAFEETLLINCSRNGLIKIVKYLVENGANIHKCDNEALRWACKSSHLEIVRYLVENGADIHANHDQALKIAIENDHLKLVKYLVKNGANTVLIPRDFLSFFHLNNNNFVLKFSIKNGHLKIVEYPEDFSTKSCDRDVLKLANKFINSHR